MMGHPSPKRYLVQVTFQTSGRGSRILSTSQSHHHLLSPQSWLQCTLQKPTSPSLPILSLRTRSKADRMLSMRVRRCLIRWKLASRLSVLRLELEGLGLDVSVP
jgi:hypothetical protein